MFTRTADAEFNGVLDPSKSSSIFDDLLKNNIDDIAKVSTYHEEDIRRANLQTLRRISERRSNILAFSTRAISSFETHGCNKNGDAFERAELEKFHKTFFLRPHLMDHKMEIEYIRGIIADSHWNKKGDYVETLIFVDRDLYPKYAAQVEKGVINSFSMGVQVDEAECSICGNFATTPDNLCQHAQHYKGLTIHGKKCFEYNRGLNFIEQSAVVSPADVDSHTIAIIASMSAAQHPEIDRLKKLAAILDSYSEQDKKYRFDEYAMIESATSRLADRIAGELGIDFRLIERTR
jgi:hypothetical protein